MTAPRPILQMRLCGYANCGTRFRAPHNGPQPAAYCSSECHRLSKRNEKPPKPRTQLPRSTQGKKRKAISEASPAQREAIETRACVVCRQHEGGCDPAHLISRAAATDGQDEPLAVVSLCRVCHDRYDGRQGPPLDLLPHLEPHGRDVLGFAVQRYGLLRTLQRVTNTHWLPVESDRRAA